MAAKHQSIHEALRKDIASGKYAAGQKLPSEAALVKRFGASRITVGRAVADLQRAGLVERRAGSGTYVRTGAPAQQGNGGGQGGLNFGLIIPDLGQTDIFEPIVQGLADSPQARDHALVWCKARDLSAPRHEQAWQICEQYLERQVAGVFFAPSEVPRPENPYDERISRALQEAGIPLVLLDRDYLPYPARSPHDLVGIDNRQAAFLATEHLRALGARRIAFLALAKRPATVEQRIAGYREALLHAGEELDPALVLRLSPEESGQPDAFLREVLKRVRPDAFVCVNDRTAGQLLQSLLRLGVRVPDEVRVVGIDDVPYASLLPVPLTTMRQPCREIGMAAMGAMLERLARPGMPPRDILLHSELVLRQSDATRSA